MPSTTWEVIKVKEIRENKLQGQNTVKCLKCGEKVIFLLRRLGRGIHPGTLSLCHEEGIFCWELLVFPVINSK